MQAVQNYYFRMKETENSIFTNYSLSMRIVSLPAPSVFDDGSVVLVTESDLDGYDESHESEAVGKNRLDESNLACRFQFASQAAIARLSFLWLRCQTSPKVSRKKLKSSTTSSELESIGVDIRVY